jgi:hypothetical protein
MVATTYHCSPTAVYPLTQGAAWIFWAQEPDVDAEKKERVMMVKTISRDELNKRIDLKDNFPLVETFDRWNLSSPTLPERH